MRVCWVLCFILHFTNIYTNDVTYGYSRGAKPNGKISEVETLLENLLQEQWNEDEVPCLEEIQTLLHGVRNHTLWATWMWDSMQRPTGALFGSRYQLGNFDQCMKPLWSGAHVQYCLADIDMTSETPGKPSGPADPYGSTHSYITKTSKHGRRLNIVTRGVCMPRVCQPRSIAKVVKHMHRDSHLVWPALDPLITVHSCQLAGEEHHYSPGFFAFLYIIAALCSIAIISTYSSGYLPSNSLASEIANCFDLIKNWEKFMRVSKDEIMAANGMKFTKSMATICAHYIFYSNTVAIINGLDLDEDLTTSFGFYTIHYDLIIDTFYAISGLLLAKSMLSGNQRSALKNLLKRYIRILGPLVVMVWYMGSVHTHVGDGPLWPLFSGELQRPCLDNWGLNFLLINNYVNATNICHTVTWYISSDFQLALFGTLLCYIYRRNERVGRTAFFLSFVLAMLIPGLVTYWKELPALFYHNIHEVIEFRTNVAFVERYIKTQCRAAAYLAGMALGYIMVTYRPSDYRKSISKKLSAIGTVVAFFVMIKVVNMGGNLFQQEHSIVQAALFTVFNRTSWAIAVCCIIAFCEYGTVPIVESYLKWGLFVPLSRLCYGMYLSHMALVYYCIYSIRSPIKHNYISMIITGLGVGMTSMVLGLMLLLFVEAPVGNLSNYLLDAKRKEVCANGNINGSVNGSVNGSAKVNGFQNGIKAKVM